MILSNTGREKNIAQIKRFKGTHIYYDIATLCVYVIINARCFEHFMCLDLVLEC